MTQGKGAAAAGSPLTLITGLLVLCLAVLSWGYALFFATTESHQGEVYRILYLHVPSAFSAFF